MMGKRRKIQALVLIAACIFSFLLLTVNSFTQQVLKERQDEPKEERVVPSPRDIKERTAIYVFIVWIWLAIIVLVYFLRLKVREADRLFRLKYFTKEKGSKSPFI